MNRECHSILARLPRDLSHERAHARNTSIKMQPHDTGRQHNVHADGGLTLACHPLDDGSRLANIRRNCGDDGKAHGVELGDHPLSERAIALGRDHNNAWMVFGRCDAHRSKRNQARHEGNLRNNRGSS